MCGHLMMLLLEQLIPLNLVSQLQVMLMTLILEGTGKAHTHMCLL